MFKKIKILSAFLVCSIAITTTAQAWNISVAIKMRKPAKIQEVQTINFGTIQQPTSTVNVHVTKAGVVGSSNTSTHIDTNDVSEGIYKISGSFISTIDISTSDNANVPGMTFTEITGDYASTIDGDLSSGVG